MLPTCVTCVCVCVWGGGGGGCFVYFVGGVPNHSTDCYVFLPISACLFFDHSIILKLAIIISTLSFRIEIFNAKLIIVDINYYGPHYSIH